jgi:hypothetical protein
LSTDNSQQCTVSFRHETKKKPRAKESVWELENRPRIGPRPVGPVAKHQPSPEGLGLNSE